jgi:peroxiredoxin
MLLLPVNPGESWGENLSATEDVFEKFQVSRFEKPVEIPDFSLPLIGGGEVKLSDYKGKVIFLNFWATWCAYCRTERAGLQATHDKYKDRGFEVLSVSIDRAGAETVEKFLQEHNITFPNLHDQKSEVALEYGIRGVPATFFIAADGKAIGGVIGPRPWGSEEAHSLVEHLLATPTDS